MKIMGNKTRNAAARYGSAVVLSFAMFLSLINLSCGGGEETTVETTKATPTPKKKVDDAQDNLSSVQRAGFAFIYVFRRADGEVLTGDDKKYLKENSPAETNQWRLTGDGKTVVAGSNYKFMPEHLDALRTRFVVEDYSKPADENVNKSATGESNNKNSNSVK
jgi:hypothetical protein